MALTMNKDKFNGLADAAGFIRFDPDEDGQTPIDWSCDYSLELNLFAIHIIRECITVVDTAVGHREPASTYTRKIKQHFGLEDA